MSLWGVVPGIKLCCFSHLKRTQAVNTGLESVLALKMTG